MAKIFLSSLVGGMEELRKAARKAVVTMGHTPIMCEDFGARSYSSEQACVHEVEQSDIYLVIVGRDYGYVTPAGISVTQAEFRAAQSTNKTVLVFVQQVDERDERQSAFLQELEHYQSGFFRSGFENAIDLNNEIIKALRQLEVMSQAINKEEFNTRVAQILRERQVYRDGPELILAMLPQPEKPVDIGAVEQNMDSYFGKLCEAGITKLRDGYKPLDHARWTGFASGSISVYFREDGLVLLCCDPTLSGSGIFAGSFVTPDRISGIAKGFRSIIESQSGYVQVSLQGMSNAYVANPPKGTSMTMRIFGAEEATYSQLFLPLAERSYNEWVDRCVSRFARTFKYTGAAD